jgi:hypothetical protein
MGISLVFLLSLLPLEWIIIITILAIIGTVVPLVLAGKCLYGSCHGEEESEE